MRPLAALGLVVVGAMTGIATVAVHPMTGWFALAAVATLLTAWALPPGWWSRLAFVLGWVAMVGWLAIPRAEGDYLIGRGWQGYALLGLGLGLLVAGVATLPPPGSGSGAHVRPEEWEVDGSSDHPQPSGVDT